MITFNRYINTSEGIPSQQTTITPEATRSYCTLNRVGRLGGEPINWLTTAQPTGASERITASPDGRNSNLPRKQLEYATGTNLLPTANPWG